MADQTDDSITESIWASPGVDDTQAEDERLKTPRTPKTPKTPVVQDETIDRDAALRKELEGVRNINAAVEGIISTLERAQGNMGVCETCQIDRNSSNVGIK
jgi:hypothetical protein